MNGNLYLYVPLMLFPVWYIFVCLNRLRRHWKDGKEHQRHLFTVLLIMKLCLVLLMIMLLFTQTLSILNKEMVIVAFYMIFSISWVFSLIMLISEFLLKLNMKWIGHRGFWVSSLIVWTVLIVINSEEHLKSFMKNIFIPRIVLFGISASINLVLAIFAVFRPDEFKIHSKHFDKLLAKSHSGSFAQGKHFFDRISIKIHDYKIKNINETQTVRYYIIVKISGHAHTMKKTYKDFENLAKSIDNIFPKQSFPNFHPPILPNFAGKRLEIQERISLLNVYLQGIRTIDYFNENTLNFFGIYGDFREEILCQHQFLLESEGGLFIQSSGDTEFVDLTQINFERSESASDFLKIHSDMPYFSVKIMTELNSEDAVEYLIKTKSVYGKEKSVKSFKDFNDLHQELRKIFDLAIMPKFPKKSYFQVPSRIDLLALELRKAKLEKYLTYLLNDPIYHCAELFDFIGVQLEYTALWEYREVRYEVITPIEWESELNDSEFIVFVLNVKKIVNSFEQQWRIKRFYKDFKSLHKFLALRNQSKMLSKYHGYMNKEMAEVFPELPKKKKWKEIEELRELLENYLRHLCSVPLIQDAYAFTTFLNDISNRK